MMTAKADFIQQTVDPQGNWVGEFGSDGYRLRTHSLLNGATFEIGNAAGWSFNVADPIRPLTPDGNSRVGDVWFGNMNVDVRFADAVERVVRFYCYDGNSGRRFIANAYPWATASSAPNESPSAQWVVDTSYVNGRWGWFSVSEGLRLTFTNTGGPNVIFAMVAWDLSAQYFPGLLQRVAALGGLSVRGNTANASMGLVNRVAGLGGLSLRRTA